MAKALRISAAIALFIVIVLSVCCSCVSDSTYQVLLPFAITFGTIAYHLVMRALVGAIFNLTMQNNANYEKLWYQVGPHEMSVYKKLKVKKWKTKLPAYDASLFDLRKHSLEEIAQAMCQAELVHEAIFVLSFLPIIAGFWFGQFSVFIATSVLAAFVDAIFAIVQRYNRQRILRLINTKKLK